MTDQVILGIVNVYCKWNASETTDVETFDLTAHDLVLQELDSLLK